MKELKEAIQMCYQKWLVICI